MRVSSIASVVFLTALLAGCAGGGTAPASTPVQAGHGALAIAISPNPIMAQKVSGETYDFPFDVMIREVGGAPVNIDQVSVDVTALGGLRIYSESYGPADIARLGYPTFVPAGGELKYHFNPRKEVADDRLFSAVSAELTVRGTDTAGNPTTAHTSVTVRR